MLLWPALFYVLKTVVPLRRATTPNVCPMASTCKGLTPSLDGRLLMLNNMRHYSFWPSSPRIIISVLTLSRARGLLSTRYLQPVQPLTAFNCYKWCDDTSNHISECPGTLQ